MSPELSEALRNEIRTALEASGGPFDINVARRVYDLAIAARDMCVAATSSVKESIDQVKDTEGPMESLDASDAPESQIQASESFGARLFRELMASLSLLQQPRGSVDPKQLVHALAEARRTGMHDVAEQIEVKLFGSVLSGPRPLIADDDASDVFARGVFDGRAGALPASAKGPYHEGYLEGTTARYLDERRDLSSSTRDGVEAPHEGRAGRRYARPPSGMENAFDGWAEQNACKVCGNQPDAEGTIEHGRGCYVACDDGGGTSSVELPTANGDAS